MRLARLGRMTRVLPASAVILALAGLAAPQPPRAAKTPAKSQRIAALRHDTSPKLRDIAPQKPAARHEPSEREKTFQRPIRKLGTEPDTIVQNFTSPALIPVPTTSFEGVGNVNAVLPPDTNADVGPNHYIQSVNVSFAIYSKSSPPVLIYGPAPTNTVFTGFGGPCETRNDGDGIVLYDHLADRWVFSQLALPNLFFGLALAPFYQCIAVSATSDPTGAYHRYQFSFNKLNDYPKLGVWPDAYYMAINQFAAISLQYAGQGVIAFDRQKMLAGLPASMQYMDLSSVDINLGGMLPADLDGQAPPPGSPGYFVQVDDDAWGYAPADRLQLWRFHVDWANPAASTFTGPSIMPTAPFDSDLCAYSRNCIPQAGTAARVDAMADRLMYRLQYRNFGSHESLVVNHTVDADGTDHAGVRWYEIRGPHSAPFIHQQGTYAPDGDHRWMASAALDSAGNMALGFSVSGAALAPSIRYTGRLANDPTGTMTQGEADVITGAGAQTHESGRWGDYSMMAVDPVDGCTFWYTQQYYAATTLMGWQTRVGTFSFPSCGSVSTGPQVTITPTIASATEAGLVAGAITVSRTGATTDPMTVSYAVTGTALPGVDYVPLPGTVTIPAGASSAVIPVTPLDDPYAEPNESVLLSLSPDPAYSTGFPSQAVVAIVSDDLPPDLVIGAIGVPASATPGAIISITDATKNQGGASNASSTAFYFSNNVLLDAADKLLGARDVPSLDAGALSNGSTDVTVPANLTTGTYYVLAKADNGNVVTESQEGNNVRFSGAIRVGPDLIVSTFTAPGNGGAGANVSVTDTTKNQGSVPAGSTKTAFYLSNNAVLDAGDPLLGNRVIPQLAADATSTGTTSVQIPQGTTTGTYFLFAKSDVDGQVTESSETNNASFGVVIRVGPDLTVASVTGPGTAATGSAVTLNDTTRNSGGGAAPASSTKLYLTTNLSVDAGDIVLGTRAVPALAGGATSAASTVVTIPAGLAPGSYWIIAVADEGAVVVETSETNNTALGILRVVAGK